MGWSGISFKSNLVCGSRHVTAASGPVNMDICVSRVLLTGMLGLDLEGVGAEVITLGL